MTDEAAAAAAAISTITANIQPVQLPPQNVKLFVGQVPKVLNEADILPLFEAFGKVLELKVIRDKHSGESKGCCFVNFERKEHADQAIATLHNKHKLPPCTNAVQVRYADNSGPRDMGPPSIHKLFVGQLPKDQPDSVLQTLFEPFGEIEEFKVLKDPSGMSKGCAFLKYTTRDSAIAAIHTLDQKHQIGNLTLQVRFAENNSRSRDQHDGHRGGGGGGRDWHPNMYSGPPPNAYPPHAYAQPPPYSMPPQNAYGQPPFVPHQGGYGHPPPNYAPPTPYGMPMYPPGQVPIPKQTSGPPGANLFIMQLPKEWGDDLLMSAFQPFGNVLSTRVFVDKNTGESKCFGFVSYDSPQSAQNAISTMNGFSVNGRALQVSLKKEGGGGGGGGGNYRSAPY